MRNSRSSRFRRPDPLTRKHTASSRTFDRMYEVVRRLPVTLAPHDGEAFASWVDRIAYEY